MPRAISSCVLAKGISYPRSSSFPFGKPKINIVCFKPKNSGKKLHNAYHKNAVSAISLSLHMPERVFRASPDFLPWIKGILLWSSAVVMLCSLPCPPNRFLATTNDPSPFQIKAFANFWNYFAKSDTQIQEAKSDITASLRSVERSDGSAFLPPTLSCRAVLAWAGEFFGDNIHKYNISHFGIIPQ